MVIVRRIVTAWLLPASGTVLVGRTVRVIIRVQKGNTRRRWTKGINMRNFIARHPAKTLESRDNWIANLRSYVRDDCSTDVLVRDGATRGIKKVIKNGVHGDWRRRG